MKYTVKMNGNYMNSFATYSEAVELAETLQNRFRSAKIEIISL
jgi:hypothetical protein